MNEELKPCPFCGGKVTHIHTNHKSLHNRTHQYNCTKCNATIFLDAEGHYKNATDIDIEAIETFNRRNRMNENNINWLISCPCNDCNFKSHLKSASVDELKIALSQLPEHNNKTKIKVIKSEMRRRTNNEH